MSSPAPPDVPVEPAPRHEGDRFRVLLDTAANVILALRPDHTIFEWSRAAERVFGVAREDALGTNYVERFVPEEQRAGVKADIVKVLGGTPTYGFEDDALLADGTRRTLLWNVTRLLHPDGRIEGILAIGQDVTALAAAERRFRQVFERSADGLMLMRTPSGVVECNQAALAMLGLTSSDELRDRHLAPSTLGGTLVSLYEAVGPTLAGFIAEDEDRRALARSALAPLIAWLEDE